jgi:Uma2 family endonuclease
MQRGIADLLRGAPDLAVEVVSSETAARLRTKIGLYLKNGSKAVWVVFPEAARRPGVSAQTA